MLNLARKKVYNNTYDGNIHIHVSSCWFLQKTESDVIENNIIKPNWKKLCTFWLMQKMYIIWICELLCELKELVE